MTGKRVGFHNQRLVLDEKLKVQVDVNRNTDVLVYLNLVGILLKENFVFIIIKCIFGFLKATSKDEMSKNVLYLFFLGLLYYKLKTSNILTLQSKL